MIRVLIIDDEKEMLELIKNRISNIQEIKGKIEIDTYCSAENALQSLRDGEHAEIILSDIELNGMNGIQFGKYVKKEFPDSHLIFLTAYSEFAAESYIISAYQYILKADIDIRLRDILIDLVKKINTEEDKYRIIKNSNGLMQFKLNEIIYIRKIKATKYVELITTHGVYRERISLEKIMEELGREEFVLIERGYIVNIRYIVRLKGNEVYLKNGDTIVVSRARIMELKNKIHVCWGR